jgi:hypothetical protein
MTSAHAADYLAAHLDALRNVPHCLSSIRVVLSSRSREPELPSKCARAISALNCPIHVQHRSNAGFAYGAFVDAFEADQSGDYYMLVEDDYVFAMPHFDEWLVNRLNAEQADMLCGRIGHCPAPMPAVFVGIMTARALRDVASDPEIRSMIASEASYATACALQVRWSKHLRLVDWSPEAPCAYWSTVHGFLCWFGTPAAPSPIVPLQAREPVACMLYPDVAAYAERRETPLAGLFCVNNTGLLVRA